MNPFNEALLKRLQSWKDDLSQEAKETLDWNYNERYQVICDNHHVATGEFNTVHRAIVRWNNAQKSLDTEPITARSF